MKKTRRLDRGYSSLRPDERFQLVIAADARGDERESELLFCSCPRSTFSMRDPAFQDRLELACEFAAATVATLLANRQRRDAVDAATLVVRRYLTMAADAVEYEAFALTGPIDLRFRRAIRRQIGGARRTLRHLDEAIALEGTVTAHAFNSFCRDELEIDAVALINVVMPESMNVFLEYLAEEPDLDAVTVMQAEFADAWKSRIGYIPNDTGSDGAKGAGS